MVANRESAVPYGPPTVIVCFTRTWSGRDEVGNERKGEGADSTCIRPQIRQTTGHSAEGRIGGHVEWDRVSDDPDAAERHLKSIYG